MNVYDDKMAHSCCSLLNFVCTPRIVFAVQSKYKVNTLYSRTIVGECKLYDPLFSLSSLNEFYEWTERIFHYIFICIAWRRSLSLCIYSMRSEQHKRKKNQLSTVKANAGRINNKDVSNKGAGGLLLLHQFFSLLSY